MTGLRFATRVTLVALLPVLFHTQACKDASSVETVKVSLNNSQAYQYPGASPPRNVKRVVFHFDIHN